MAKIRLPKTRPDVGVSPIPQIAPTTADPGAVLASGLVSIGGQLVDRAKKQESEDFATGLRDIAEGSLILNDDGSVNLSESTAMAENLATKPKETLGKMLGEDRANTLLANPKFSVPAFRQEMAKKANEYRGAESVEIKHSIDDMIKQGGLSPQNIFAVEDAYEDMLETVDSITDVNIRANAQNTVLRPIALMNEFTDVAKKEGFVSTISYMRAIENGQFDFLDPDKDKIYKDLTKWMNGKVAESMTVVNGVSGTVSTGFASMDFDSGNATLSDSTGQLSYILSNEEGLPSEVVQAFRKTDALINADYASKESVSYIFSDLGADKVTPINTMSNDDLQFAIQNQFIPEMLSRTGIEQEDYLKKVVLKAHRATDGLNPVLKDAIKSLVKTEETAKSVLSLLTNKKNTLFSTGENGIFANSFTDEELTYFNSLQHYLTKEGNIKAAIQALEQERLQRKDLTELGVAPLAYDTKTANELIETAMGVTSGLSAEASLEVQTYAEQTYARLMQDDPSRDPEETKKEATKIAVQQISKTSMPVFNRVEAGPTREFFLSNDIPFLTNEEKGNYIEGAIIRAGREIGLDLDEGNADNYRFEMAEIDDNGERKIQVTVRTADMNLVAVGPDNKYQPDPSKTSRQFIFNITGADFMSFRTPETENKRNVPALVNLYEQRRQEGKSQPEVVRSLKNSIMEKLFGIRKTSFIHTDPFGNPIKSDFQGQPLTYESVLPYNRRGGSLGSLEFHGNERYLKVLEVLETLNTPEEVIKWSEENMADPLRSIFGVSVRRSLLKDTVSPQERNTLLRENYSDDFDDRD